MNLKHKSIVHNDWPGTSYIIIWLFFPIYNCVAVHVFTFLNKIIFGSRPEYGKPKQGNFIFGELSVLDFDDVSR